MPRGREGGYGAGSTATGQDAPASRARVGGREEKLDTGPDKWLRTLKFEHPADTLVFEDYLLAIEHLEERLKGLVSALEAAAQKEPYRERVSALRCFQGFYTVTAITVVAELHDFRRFQSPRELMGFLGLVPSEHSSSDRRSLGGITKAGNTHARRALIESSWQYRHPPRLGEVLRKRREGQPAAVIAIALMSE